MRREWSCTDGSKWFLCLEDWQFRMRVGHLLHRNLQDWREKVSFSLISWERGTKKKAVHMFRRRMTSSFCKSADRTTHSLIRHLDKSNEEGKKRSE